jgi:hypothetical protein
LSSLATASGSQFGVGLHEDAAVGAHGERGADRLLACAGPIETATISVAAGFLQAHASSTAISSKGFIDILTLASSTPVRPPSRGPSRCSR